MFLLAALTSPDTVRSGIYGMEFSVEQVDLLEGHASRGLAPAARGTCLESSSHHKDLDWLAGDCKHRAKLAAFSQTSSYWCKTAPLKSREDKENR